MFRKPKNNETKNDRIAPPAQQFQRPLAASSEGPVSTNEISSISSDIAIVGKITGKGTVKISGRIDGELHASIVLITDGAQVEGDIFAEEVTIGGRVKGTIHANRVKLNGNAIVEGDIFHRSLSIEENARFEGSSRRKEIATDTDAQADFETVSVMQAGQKQNAPLKNT
jgi:cytoskeletal protein CcmA (bactofilin family)